MSSVVLDSYQELLKDHLVVTLFLTMLVRARDAMKQAWAAAAGWRVGPSEAL